jgi:hypothetical protein
MVKRRLVCLFWLAASCGGGDPPSVHRAALNSALTGVWSEQRLESSPPPRGQASMVYDPSGLVIVFGGNSGTSELNDTWFLASISNFWQQGCTYACTPPGPRDLAASAYDSAHNAMVLFGGVTSVGVPISETWLFDGSTWTHKIVTGPSARFAAAMAFDSGRGRAILYGGTNATVPGGANGETWDWDGTVWAIHYVSGPGPRFRHAMAYDAARGKIVLYGGTYNGTLGDTWEWDGQFWTQVCTSAPCSTTTPGPREGHSLAYDSYRQRTVLFGSDANDTAQTWEWDGTRWALTASGGPLDRFTPGLAFDPQRRAVVMFGGDVLTDPQADTWLYYGRGEPCGVNACDTLQCTDGVCCDQAVCGICQACNTVGSPGACAPVTNADDDTCTGMFTCDATGTCKKKNGQACSAATDCASGFCVTGPTGICCDRACTLGCESCNPAGAAGTCITVAAGTPSSRCGALVCNGVNAECPISCARDADCAAGFWCSQGACTTQAPNGTTCASDSGCKSGHCRDGVCCDSDCSGRCQSCAGAQPGTCAVAVGSDPHHDCAGDVAACAGTCQADATCKFPGAETACDVCKVCNQSGRCNALPLDGDDPACGTVACAGLSTECRVYDDLTTRRCAAAGLCASPNDPAGCLHATDLPDGTPCSGGVCRAGVCGSARDAGAHPGGSSTAGCDLGAARPTAAMGWLVLLALGAACLRARETRSRPATRAAPG